jgi:hypothetical protein
MAHLISLSSVNIVHHVSAAKTLKAIHNIIVVPTVNDPSSIFRARLKQHPPVPPSTNLYA